MKILFAFNGSQAESKPAFLDQLVPCKLLGTCRTGAENASVLLAEPANASNDGTYGIAGQIGQVGHIQVDVKPVNTPIKLDTNLVASVVVTFTERHVAIDSFNYSESDDFDGAEYRKKIALNTKLVNCESCVHFDFLASPVSQSCMIKAAKPHKRYPKMTFQDIVAECTKREAHQILDDHNIQNEVWNHETDYPF